MKKPTTTAKKPALSYAAKPAAKKPTQTNEVLWIRTITGDEFVSETKTMIDGLLLINPTAVTFVHQNLILAPYGMMASEMVFLNKHAVMHATGVTDKVVELYHVSIKTGRSYAEKFFEKIVDTAISLAKVPMDNTPVMDFRELLNANKEDLAKIFSEASEENAATFYEEPAQKEQRTKREMIDDLIKLANQKGKGNLSSGET